MIVLFFSLTICLLSIIDARNMKMLGLTQVGELNSNYLYISHP